MQGLASRSGDDACVSGSCGEGAALPAQLQTKLIPTMDPCNTAGGKRTALNKYSSAKACATQAIQTTRCSPLHTHWPCNNTAWPGQVSCGARAACCI